MKPRATSNAPLGVLFDLVCRMGGKLSVIPMLLSFVAAMSISQTAVAQKGNVPVQETQPPTVIVVNDYHPGEGHVPAEVAQYVFARESGGDTGPSPVINTCPSDLIVECFDDVDHVISQLDYDIFCGPAAFVFIYQPPGILETGSCPGTVYEIEYVVWDQCGASTSCTQTFTLDNDGPEITFCPEGGEIVSPEQAFPDVEAIQTDIICPNDPLCAEITTTVTLTEAFDPCLGQLFIYTYALTDGCDRTAECEQVFNILPAPLELACDEDETVECLSDIMPSEDDVEVINAIEDESIETTVTVGDIVFLSGDEGCDGAQYEVTYTVTDDCGREASCTRTFTIENEGPEITAPADVVIECAADAASDIEGAMAMAACDLDYEVTAEGPNLLEGDGFCDGSVWEFVYTVTDECGREATDTQMVTISNDGPSITAPEAVTIECAADAAADIEGAMAMTSCELDYEITAEGPNLLEGDGVCDGSVWEFVYTVTDECGREATDTQMVTISNDGPTITAPEAVTIDCAANAAADIEGAMAMTSCELGYEITAGDPELLEGDGFCPGSLWQIVYTVTDECGRTAQDAQLVTIDNDGPSIEAPADVTIDCAADTSPEFTGEPTAFFPCGEGDVTFEDLPITGTCPQILVRVWSATDGCSTATAEQTITLEDTTAPELFMPEVTSGDITCQQVDPDDAVAYATGQMGPGETAAFLNVVRPLFMQNGLVPTGTSDDCSDSDWDEIDVNVITEDLEDCTVRAILECIFVAIDECGNTSEPASTFLVINSVNDPEITAPADAVIECAEDAAPNFGDVMASADCNLGFEVTADGPNLLLGDGFCDGSVWEFVYTVTDECGREATDTQMVTISNQGPNITAPEDVIIECAADAAADIEGAMAMTACNLDYVISAEGPNLLEGDGFCDGSIWEFVYTVTDECGREATDTQMVTISNEGPTITAPEDVIIECAADAAADIEGAMAMTACELDYEITAEGPNLLEGDGFCDGSVWEFVYTVTDECGREATDTQMVTIENDGPVISAPADAEVSCIDEVVADFENLSAMAACNLDYDVAAGDPVLIDGVGSCNGAQYSITYTITDQCQRTAASTQIFTIVNDGLQVDEDALPQDTTVECYEDITSDPMTVYNAVTTACSTDVFVQIVPPTKACCDANCPGTEYVMTYTIIDACGDTYTHLQTFTIENDAPLLEVPADMAVTCAEDIMIDMEGVTATASCDLELGEIEVGDLTPVGEADNCNGDQYTVTYSVTDECGRTSTATQTFTIENDGPSVTAPADETVECFTDIMADTDAAAGSTFCELGYMITASAPQLMEGEAECDGAVYAITYTITDDCGETATDDQMFTIENVGPMVTAPADVTVECAADAAPDMEGVTVMTSCQFGFDLSVEGPELVEGDGVCDGSVWKFTYTATDDCGRFASDEQLVTISNDAPVITAPADVTLACAADAVVDTAGVMVMTSCELGYELTFEGPTLIMGENGFCDGSVWQIVYTATDECGRMVSDTQNINIENDGLVLPMAPENMTVQCDEEVPEMAELVATDPCGEAVTAMVASSITEGDCPNSFTINRSWSFDDGCGEPAVLMQTINVIDDEAPVWDESCELTSTYFTSDGVDCPADAAFSLEVGDEITTSDSYMFAGQTVPAIGGCVTDNCTDNADLIIRVADISSEGSDCEKSFVITFEAEDECGNIAGDFSCTFTVIDDVAPELFMPEATSADITCDQVDPAQAILFGNGEMSAGEEQAFLSIVRPLFVQNGLIPTGTQDDCNDSDWEEITVNVVSEGLDCPTVAILQCFFVAFDDCGNTSETAMTQLVINSVNDPSIEAPADMDITCASDAVPMLEAAYASADCGLDFTTSVEGPNLISGDGFCDGSVWEFVYIVTDECQRTDSAVQTVTISNNGPMITSCGPEDEVVETIADITASIDDVMFTADCEDIDVMVTISDPEIVDNECEGLTYTYSYMVMDDCGRVDECQRTITVTQNPSCFVEACENFALYYINWESASSTVFTLYGANIVDGNAELTELTTVPYKAHIAYDENDELVYLVDQDGNFVDVYDPATGVIDMDARINLNPALGSTVTAAAFNPEDGVLYVGRGANNQIRGINLNDGSSAQVATAPVEGGDLAFVGDQLYLSTNEGPGPNPNLYLIDINAGTSTLVGPIPGSQNNGLAVSDDNNLLVSGQSLNAFVKVDPAGTELASFPTTLNGAPFTTGLGDLASGCNSGLDLFTPCYGAEVLDFFQGPQTDGNPVAEDRSDPSVVLGPPSLDNSAGNFFSLGVGGFIEIAFDGMVPDLPGNDILVVETSFSGDDCGLSDDEFADIALTQDGITWVEYGTICRNEEIDIADVGLDFVVAIRITNSAITTTLDGYDVDGVVALQGCQPNDFEIPEGDCYGVDAFVYNPVGPIAPERMDPTQALGEPERDNTINFVSLGFGGSITIGFGGAAPAIEGVNDLEVVETTFGDHTCVSFEERADVYVSQQLVSDASEIDDDLFVYVGQSCTNGEFFDVFGETGFTYFTMVKIVDVTPEEAQLPGRDGYDVDGVVAIHNCVDATPGPTQALAATFENVMETFPNPTEGQSNVTFTTGKTTRTMLQVYDASGREVATLFNQTADAGMEYRLNFDGRSMPNGMYIYRLTTEDEVIVRKFMIAK